MLSLVKRSFAFQKKPDDTKYTADELKVVPIEEVKKWIEAELPNAFGKKKAAKKAPAKTAVKEPGKKTTTKKKK